MANNFEVNYEDERFQQVEAEKQEALTDLEQTYGNMINESDKYYQAQINASKQWANTQSKLQQQQTDFAIEQIEQQKDQAQKDYTKEQSGAFVDWKKQSAQHGVNAEQMAAQGMQGTGFSESSQVSMYNTYQNRVATARESFNLAVLNYNNAIKDARLQNNSALAEIAYQALQTQLELSLQGFQYKNNLIIDLTGKKQELDDTYYSRYQDVLNQINTENAMAEEVRQYEQNFAYQQERDAIADQQWKTEYDETVRQYNQNYQLQTKNLEEEIRQFNQNYSLQVKEYEEGIRQFNVEIARLKENDAKAYAMEIEQLELKKQQLEEEKRQFDASAEEQKRQFDLELAESKRQFDARYGADEEDGPSESPSINKGGPSNGGVAFYDDGSFSNKHTLETGFTGATRDDAIKYLVSKGVSQEKLTALMTASEWTKRKQANSSSPHVKNFDSYKAYLAAYVEYATE